MRKARLLAAAGWDDAEATPLAADWSSRRFWRLARPGGTAVLMEDVPGGLGPFEAIAAWLRGIGVQAPAVLAVDAQAGLILMEDLGPDLVAEVVADGGLEPTAYAAATDLVLHWQRVPPPDWLPRLDASTLLDLLEVFLERLVIDREAHRSFRALWRPLLGQATAGPEVFVHRDLHSRNLLWRADGAGLDRLGVVDFQDAFRGPLAYDLVSLLQDARRDVTAPVVDRARARFLAGRPDLDCAAFDADYAILGAQRALRILAVFDRVAAGGRRLDPDCVPRTRRHLARNLRHPALADLRAWCALHYPLGNPLPLG